MRRILSTVVLCMLVSISFAQKKAVKEAKNAMNSDKFSEARTLIKPALTNPETESDPETWKVAGDIENKAFDKEKTNEMMRKTVNEEVMFTSLYNSYDPYVKADQLGELPDDKGKIKNKYRKDIAAIMKANHAYFANGGLYYNDKKQFAKAADYFEKYWDMPSLPMFEDEKSKIEVVDSTFQIIKYYAVLCANYAGDHDRAINYLHRIMKEPFAENSLYQESHVYELLASEYNQKGDSVKFMQTLEDGAKKYPKSNYFVTNLVNVYIKRKEADKAVAYLDQAIANDPTNACEFYGVKASIYGENNEFDNSVASYNQALSADGNCERALEGLAVLYILKAQDTKEIASKAATRKEQSDLDLQVKDLYNKAIPLLQKYKTLLEARKAENSDIKAALYKLRNVYYNLNMNDEYDATEKEYNAID